MKVCSSCKQEKTLENFYKDKSSKDGLSYSCFQEYHVDHIIPLKNSKVCGLHTQDNLQIIPAHDNLRKSNKLCLN